MCVQYCGEKVIDPHFIIFLLIVKFEIMAYNNNIIKVFNCFLIENYVYGSRHKKVYNRVQEAKQIE